jgi:hypothetical protein
VTSLQVGDHDLHHHDGTHRKALPEGCTHAVGQRYIRRMAEHLAGHKYVKSLIRPAIYEKVKEVTGVVPDIQGDNLGEVIVKEELGAQLIDEDRG